MKIVRFKNCLIFQRQTETEVKILDPEFYTQCITRIDEIFKKLPKEFQTDPIEWRVEIVHTSIRAPPKICLVQTKGESCLDTFLIYITG